MTYGKDVQLRAEKCSEEHSKMISDFDCGTDNINHLIHIDSCSSGTVSYLYVDQATETLVAYASIACTGVVVLEDEFDGDDAGLEPQSSILSAVEIEYFAVHKEYQKLPFAPDLDSKETLSYCIFMDVIEQIRHIARNYVGARAVVLYSVPDAIHFYERCGLVRLSDGMKGRKDLFVDGCTPMIMRI